ncbi:MAG: hypothetical protein AAFQ90_02905 [Pseudomonadota bacterium]
MSFVGKSLASVSAMAGLSALGLWSLGAKQPSRVIHTHDSVIFLALRHDDASYVKTSGFLADRSLWRASAAFAFISDTEHYWTDYLILPDDPSTAAEITARLESEFADVYAARVHLTPIPSIVTGLLRAQHLAGLTRRPNGPLPEGVEAVEGRRDVMPTQESFEKSFAMDPDTQVTMVNFLAYFPSETGDKERGRRAYRRYGKEAMKAVHRVGGQFLFSGTITSVIAETKHHPAPGVWDDLAAMIYPDPTAIFYMEQNDDYRRALGWRDESLEHTRVIATVSY